MSWNKKERSTNSTKDDRSVINKINPAQDLYPLHVRRGAVLVIQALCLFSMIPNLCR